MCERTQSKFAIKDDSCAGFGLYLKNPVKRSDCLNDQAVLLKYMFFKDRFTILSCSDEQQELSAASYFYGDKVLAVLELISSVSC